MSNHMYDPRTPSSKVTQQNSQKDPSILSGILDSNRKILVISTGIALCLAALNSVGPKFKAALADLKAKDKPTPEKPVTVSPKVDYMALARDEGLIMVRANGPRLTDVIANIQSKLSPNDLEQAVSTVSLKANTGFYVSTNTKGVELQPISSAKLDEGGVTVAFLKPKDPAVLAEIKRHFPTIEISPAELTSQDVLDMKGHLATTGGAIPKPEDLKIRQLAGGAVEVRIKDIYEAIKEDSSYASFQAKQQFVRLLRESLGETTFSQQLAVAGTHANVATKITGGNTESSHYLGNLLEAKLPNLVAGQGFTIPVTPVFLENSGKDLVIYFGNATDLENFKTRFFPK